MIVYIDSTGKIYGGTYGKTVDDLKGITHIPSGAEYAILVDDTQYPDVQTNMGEYTISNVTASDVYYVPTATGTPTYTPIPDATKLANAQSAKEQQLIQSYFASLQTFQSSALGASHTYYADERSMTFLASEYAFVRSADYDQSTINWLTQDAGKLTHTGAQIAQVFLDGRNYVKNQDAHLDSLIAQVKAATTVDAVNAINW